MMGELGLRDVTHDADMSRRDLDRTVVGAKVAAVPGAAEQRGELASFATEDMEHGREFLREQEEPAIGGRLLIAQCMEDAARCGASGGDAARRPERVRLGEEARVTAPAALAEGVRSAAAAALALYD